MSISTFRYPTWIKYGPKAVRLVPQLIKDAKVQRPLVVTDRGLAETDIFINLLTDLKDSKIQHAVFSDAYGNPTENQVKAGVEVYKEHACDAVIIMGGGCALDVGKAIGLMAKHPGELFDYEDDLPGARPIQANLLPWMLAIPTTSGTGSEVGGSSVISREGSKRKVIVWGHDLVPKMVVADPELTIGLPKAVTASTGIDALTHNIEAYLAKNFHPLSEGISLQGVSYVGRYLKQACDEPKNVEARGGMLLAAMMGAVAFQKGLGVTHSCAHALSTCYDIHHGLANALMLIPCMRFNAETHSDKFIALSHAVGLKPKKNAVDDFIDWLQDLKNSIGIPSGLKAMNVQLTDELVEIAFKDPCHQNNPRECTKKDFYRLFEQAM